MQSRALRFLFAIIACCTVLFPWNASAQGQTLFTTTFGCSGCHSDPPDNLRRNTGNTRAVVDQAISINAGGWMGRYKSVGVDGVDGAEPVTGAQRDAIVAYIGTHVQTATATVPYHGSVSVTLRDMQVDGSTVLTNVTTASVTNGNLTGLNLQAGNFVPPTITYNHTANSCSNGSRCSLRA